MKKVLVLGSNSFSGSNFINYLLNKNFFVYGVSRSLEPEKIFLTYKKNKNLNNYKFYKLNIKKDYKKIFNLVKKNNIEYIVNFASQGMVAESWKNPLDWYETNVISSVRLVEYFSQYKRLKKFLHISTPEVYGSTKPNFKESFNFNPTTPYANSRAAFDIHLRNLHKFFNFPVVFARAANIYGPAQQLYRVIPKIIISCLKKQKIYIDGGGSSKRSFIYIDDVIRGYFSLMIKGKAGSVYHLSSKNYFSIKDIVNKTIYALGKKYKKYVVYNKKDRIGKDQNYSLSFIKIYNEIGWIEKVNIDEGIMKTLHWIKTNFQNLNKKKLYYTHKK